KMGISSAASYRGGHVLEALGLGAEVMERCFPGVPSHIGGADLAELDQMMRKRVAEVAGALPDHGRVRFRKAGEHHAYNPIAVRAAQKAAQEGDSNAYGEWRRLSRMDGPQSLRDLMTISTVSPVEVNEVEPAAVIVKRFVSTAMSLGALSPEAHEALAMAMNQIGARSNSGEGGEDPDTYIDSDIRHDNRVKQVAESGVGTIAAGVVKARADYVLVSGHDGGTGASPLSSIKNAGVPWELGLAETQQVLVANRLRERVSLRTDGGLRNGRD